MKKLCISVLVCSYVGISFGADLQSTVSDQPGNLVPPVKGSVAPLTLSTKEKGATSAQNALKALFPHQKTAEGDRIRQPVAERTSVDTDQLQAIIEKLPPSDQKVLSAVRTQIATWPQEIFEEISSYREFVIGARKIAQQKYDLLSQEAKSALESEKQLKAQLSSETVQKLEALDASVLN